MTGAVPTRPLAWRGGRWQAVERSVPREVPVALSFDGTTHAVMMATPADLKDFARGFALTEGIALPAEIAELAVVEVEGGFDLQCWLARTASERLVARRRAMVGPVGCGLCGLDSIAAALGSVRKVPPSSLSPAPEAVAAAMNALPGQQPLRNRTRATHAAAFWTPDRGLLHLREDVGRHNALDKLVGAVVGAGDDPSQGAILLTSRVSIDLVQKAAALGAPVLVAVSSPTAEAAALADAAGITLIALARGDGFEVFSHPGRLRRDGVADVA